jgi:hypothetical protein
MPKALTSAPSAPPSSATNSSKSSAANGASATGNTGSVTGPRVQQQPPPAAAPPGWHQDQLGKQQATPQDPSAKAMFQSQETVAALNSRRGSVFTTRASPGAPGSTASEELAPQSGSLHAMAKKPTKDHQQLATKHQAQLSAWVEQGRDPVIQKSSEAGGVCSVMVEEWSREGLKGPSGEAGFRNTLNSGDYQQFVDLQKKSGFVQQQVVQNENFIVSNSLASQNLSVDERRTLQQETLAHDRNNHIPGLNTRNVTPQNPAITTNLDFAFELSRTLQRDQPAEGTSAFYKLGITDTSGAGHAIGLKTEHLPGGKLEHSMLDPNTGEFTKIPQQNFATFIKEHMNQTYDKGYQGGEWSMHRVTQ